MLSCSGALGLKKILNQFLSVPARQQQYPIVRRVHSWWAKPV